jgi:hypothetical protein
VTGVVSDGRRGDAQRRPREERRGEREELVRMEKEALLHRQDGAEDKGGARGSETVGAVGKMAGGAVGFLVGRAHASTVP